MTYSVILQNHLISLSPAVAVKIKWDHFYEEHSPLFINVPELMSLIHEEKLRDEYILY